MKTNILTALVASATLLQPVLSSCAHGTFLHRRAEGAIEEPTFGYEGEIGPLRWSTLAPENEICSTGKRQSPINLSTGNSTIDSGAAYKLNIPNTVGSEFENLGTTVEVLVNGTLDTPLKSYKMKQFHFHTPSEHRVNGEFFPMESHFVFEAEDKSIAVVGFLIELGPTNDPLIGSVLPSVNQITSLGNTVVTPPLDFTALQAHVASNTVFRYSGSLTTPPCSEGVDWIISTKPLAIDEATFAAAKSVIKFNSRLTQGQPGGINLLQASV